MSQAEAGGRSSGGPRARAQDRAASPTGRCGSSASPSSSTASTSTSPRGDSNQLKAAFHVGDVDDRDPVLRLHLGERHRHAALGLPGRPLEPHQGDGGDDRGLVGHQRGGRTRADVRLRAARDHPRHARLRPGHHRPLGQQRHRRLLRDRASAARRSPSSSASTTSGSASGLVIGGALGPLFGGQGWRVAFFVSIIPGLARGLDVLAPARAEPRHGRPCARHAERRDGGLRPSSSSRCSRTGCKVFMREMVSGLNRDMRVIISIPTLRFALVGVSTVGFVVTAVGTWMPSFYQNQLGLTQTQVHGRLRPPARPRRHPRHHLGRAGSPTAGSTGCSGRASSSLPYACS